MQEKIYMFLYSDSTDDNTCNNHNWNYFSILNE